MFRRTLDTILLNASKTYPSITLFGPRQSGKTTLAKGVFPSYHYVNLENAASRELAETDVEKFFSLHPAPVILDEVQRVPSIASAVQVRIDENRDAMGQFILTGSQQPVLAAAISQSLAGRTSVQTLLPLSLVELQDAGRDLSTDEMILRGFMPDIHGRNMDPTEYYRNYVRTYVERDLRQLVNVRNLLLFERFLMLLAGRVGQIVNYSALAGETGVSSQTISDWVSILESSFLVFRLPPYFSNISKRVVKSPKIYFTDVGLVAYLLGLETTEQVSRDPLRGQLFENLVVADVYKRFLHRGKDARIAFLRTEKGFEIDLIIQRGTSVQPVEIKSSMTYHASLAQNLRVYMESGARVCSPVLVYDGEAIPSSSDRDVAWTNFRRMPL